MKKIGYNRPVDNEMEDNIQIWEHTAVVNPIFALKNPFTIKQLTNQEIQIHIDKARKNGYIERFHLPAVHSFELNKLDSFSRLLFGRNIQTILN